MSIVTQLAGPACELGEGPHYDAASNTAWWFDILNCKLLEHRFDGAKTLVHDLPKMGSVIARIDDQHQILALEDGLYRRAKADGGLTLLCLLEAENTVTRSNDGRLHPSGNLWIGTMGKKAEKGAGAIYWYGSGELRLLYPDISIPNSICFSPDGTRGYFCDTLEGIIWQVELDPENGVPRAEPDVFVKAGQLPKGGGFDGSIVDQNGVLWNAAWGGGSVTGFSPDGTIMASYDLPARQVSCPCFAGEGKMLVTSATQGYDTAAKKADPGAGRTYIIDGKFEATKEPVFKLT